MRRRLLSIAWLLALLVLLGLSRTMQGTATSFLGIADNREQTVSFEHAVEIVRIPVAEGAEVEGGVMVLEVRRPDLASELAVLGDNIQELKSRRRLNAAETRARLEGLRSERSAELVKLDTQIQSLEAREDLNQSLLAEISGGTAEGSPERGGPIREQLRGLRTRRGHVADSLQAEIRHLQGQLQVEDGPFESRIAELEERRTELKRQAGDLRVLAKFDGRVGSVLQREGERIAPFETILTLHGTAPEFIKGYIYENVLSSVAVGQKVWVSSVTSRGRGASLVGTVGSLGTRIVEYPPRLRKNPMVPAWGREVVVQLTNGASLLLGEKVVVSLEPPASSKAGFARLREAAAGLVATCRAATPWASDIEQGVREIRSDLPSLDASEFEASGVLWDEQGDRYIVVSDETHEGGPRLHVMNRDGLIRDELPLPEQASIDDMESISAYGESVMVLASLSHDSKGELKPERRRLLQLELNPDGVELMADVDLYALLTQLLRDSAFDEEGAEFMASALTEKTLDVEGHAVVDDVLYLGCKAPLDSLGRTRILGIPGLKGLLSGRPPGVPTWRAYTLRTPGSDVPARLSDLLHHEGRLLVLAYSKDKGRATAHLWSEQPDTETLEHVASFPDFRAEGVASHPGERQLLLVADRQGTAPSLFQVADLRHRTPTSREESR